MTVIIDTHIFLWLLNDPSRIKSGHMDYIEDTTNKIFLSSMSIAELLIKKSIGKLDFSFDMMGMIENMGIEVLDFTAHDALQLERLPLHHKDPFDRMIISQALSNKYFMMSYDGKFSLYACKLL